MPAIKRLHKACKNSFSANGPVSEEALEQVRTLLGEHNKARLLIIFKECQKMLYWLTPVCPRFTLLGK